eukprot:286718_1
MSAKTLYTFKRIDELIAKYYKICHIDNYFNPDGIGRFLQYIFDEELDDSDIPLEEELGTHVHFKDCIYVQFDMQNFPTNNVNQVDRMNEIFSIITYCYKYDKVPDKQDIAALMERNRTLNLITCVCGRRLTKIANATTLYDNNGAYCDICLIHSKCGDACSDYWHCDQKSNEFHPNGYDICNKCKERYFQRPELDSIPTEKMEIKYDCNVVVPDTVCNIINCPTLFRLNKSLEHYYQKVHEYVENIDRSEILVVFNDFMHCISGHQNLDHLNHCPSNIIPCPSNRRNNRDRMLTNHYKCKLDINAGIFTQIMDKIHCHISHSSRICQDKQNINNIDNIKSYKTNRIKRYTELNAHTTVKQEQIYSFGYNFRYNYNSYKGYDEETHGTLDHSILVKAKHNCLKQEMIQNMLFRVTLAQFNNEYGKAEIYCASNHCKSLVPIKTQDKPAFGYPVSYKYDTNIPLLSVQSDYIVSLMFYCNYDALQRRFSRTYRENEGKDHSMVYWMGRCLKRLVAIYGRTNGRTTRVFYHGINKQLLLAQYCSGTDYGSEFDVYCPLSTSLSKSVATNFAENIGMLIQFGGMKNYFECSWLSDFGYERECLFIQQVKNEFGMQISSIIDCQSGIDYHIILETLDLIKEIFCNIIENYGRRCTRVVSQIHQSLIRMIIHNQLSKVIPVFQSFESLTEYSQSMCNDLFTSISHLDMDYLEIKRKHPGIVTLLFIPEYEWIDINLVRILMPNVRKISIRNIDLCSQVMDDICNVCIGRILNISISVTKNSRLGIKQAIDEYSESLSNKMMYISGKLYSRSMEIDHCYSYDFIAFLLDSIGTKYFKFVDQQLKELLKEYMKMLILINASENIDVVLTDAQRYLHTYCLKTYQLDIDWRDYVSNASDHPFKAFYYTDCEWINLETIHYLFPNFGWIKMRNIRLNTITFDRIIEYLLKYNNTKIFIDVSKPKQRRHNDNQLEYVSSQMKVIKLCKKLKKYSLNEIVKSDKGFDKLYNIRKMIQHNTVELDYLDELIAEYAVFKYANQFELEGFKICVDKMFVPRIVIEKTKMK